MLTKRLAVAAALVVLVAASALAISQLTKPTSPGPTATSASSGSATGPASSTAQTLEVPAAARAVAPTAVIDLAGMVADTIPLTTDGTNVWVGVDGAVIQIDGRTNATRRIEVAHMSTGNGSIAITPEGLWIEDHNGGRIERIDPATGAVELTASTAEPIRMLFVDDQLWIDSQEAPGAHLVDRETGSWGKSWIGSTNVFSIGLGSVWMGEWDGSRPEGDHSAADLITRYDAITAAKLGTIAVPPGTGCMVSGAFPDNVWAGCPTDFGACPADRTAVRIDPATNKVVTTARICGTPVVVIDGTPSFLIGRKDGEDEAYSLVPVDPASGKLLAQLDLGKVAPNSVVATGSAVWISDELGDRVLRYDLTDLPT
jgi:hypothetical protein